MARPAWMSNWEEDDEFEMRNGRSQASVRAVAAMAKQDQCLTIRPEAVTDTLRCPICLHVYDDPVYSSGRPCQHVFCRSCIMAAFKNSFNCPVCLAEMRPDSLERHQVLGNLLDELEVRCRAGCGWTGRRAAENAHYNNDCPIQLFSIGCVKLLDSSDAACSKFESLIGIFVQRIADASSEITKVRQELVRVRKEAADKDSLINKLESELQIAKKLAENNAEIAFAEHRRKRALKELKQAEEDKFQAQWQNWSLRLSTHKVWVTYGGHKHACHILLEEDIDSIIPKMIATTGVPEDCFYLAFQGRHLEKGIRFREYGISEDATIDMTVRPSWVVSDEPESEKDARLNKRKSGEPPEGYERLKKRFKEIFPGTQEDVME